MRLFLLAAAAASALALVPVAAAAQDTPWSGPAAIRAADRADDPMLSGMLAAYEMRDDEAITRLTRYLAGAPEDAEARRAARSTLAAVHLRNGAYAESADSSKPPFLSSSPDRPSGAESSRPWPWRGRSPGPPLNDVARLRRAR